MTEQSFTWLCMFAQRIEREVEEKTFFIYRLTDYSFRTIPERELKRASDRLRSAADFIDGKLAEIEAARGRAA